MTTSSQQIEESPKPRARTSVTKERSSKTTRAKRPSRKSVKKTTTLSPEQRHEMISVAAYYIAERRGFQDGNPEADWLEAESQFDIEVNQ